MAEVQTQTEAGEMTQIFVEFVMMQAQNAALFLGQIPNPRGGPTEINIPLAKMFIDQLAVIQVKTHGNLNPDEQRVIDSAVAQLEAAFEEVLHASGQGRPGIVYGAAPAGGAPQAPESQTQEAAQPSSILPPDAPPAPPAPPAEPAPEEGRKRFTKSYGA